VYILCHEREREVAGGALNWKSGHLAIIGGGIKAKNKNSVKYKNQRYMHLSGEYRYMMFAMSGQTYSLTLAQMEERGVVIAPVAHQCVRLGRVFDSHR
jgi:hypothetical protein